MITVRTIEERNEDILFRYCCFASESSGDTLVSEDCDSTHRFVLKKAEIDRIIAEGKSTPIVLFKPVQKPVNYTDEQLVWRQRGIVFLIASFSVFAFSIAGGVSLINSSKNQPSTIAGTLDSIAQAMMGYALLYAGCLLGLFFLILSVLYFDRLN